MEQTVRVAGTVRERLTADNGRLVNRSFEAFALPDPPGTGRGPVRHGGRRLNP